MQILPVTRNLISTKEKVTQMQYLRLTHTYDLIEPKFRRKKENKTERKRNKQIVSLRTLFCISSSLLSISLSLISKLTRKSIIFPSLTTNICRSLSVCWVPGVRFQWLYCFLLPRLIREHLRRYALSFIMGQQNEFPLFCKLVLFCS